MNPQENGPTLLFLSGFKVSFNTNNLYSNQISPGAMPAKSGKCLVSVDPVTSEKSLKKLDDREVAYERVEIGAKKLSILYPTQSLSYNPDDKFYIYVSKPLLAPSLAYFMLACDAIYIEGGSDLLNIYLENIEPPPFIINDLDCYYTLFINAQRGNANKKMKVSL
jgi:hypothetical protein